MSEEEQEKKKNEENMSPIERIQYWRKLRKENPKKYKGGKII